MREVAREMVREEREGDPHFYCFSSADSQIP